MKKFIFLSLFISGFLVTKCTSKKGQVPIKEATKSTDLGNSKRTRNSLPVHSKVNKNQPHGLKFKKLSKISDSLFDNGRFNYFRTGTFYYNPTKGSLVKMSRDKNLQTESFILNGQSCKIICAVKWIADSVYVLQVKQLNFPSQLSKGDWFKCKIIDTKKDSYYIVRCALEKFGLKNRLIQVFKTP